MLMLSRGAVLALAVTWLAACGGQSELTGEDSDAGEGGLGGTGATGGTSRGGTGAVGGSTGGTGAVGGSTGGTGNVSAVGGSGAVGGSTGGTGAVGGSTGGTGAVGAFGGSAGVGASGGVGGTTCCAAAPACDANEVEIPGPDACPAGAECHSVSVCCSTIWCANEIPNCTAFPACDAGDTTLDGPCPPDVACYSRSVCGATVWCIDECSPATEYNRDYVTEDPEACLLADFACPAETTHFENDCGCGCEQASNCPESFYCVPPPDNARAAPGAAPAPPLMMCNPEELQRCPYSQVINPLGG